MRTLTSQAESLRYGSNVKLVWLIEATFDEYGQATTTKRYADSAFTLSSNAYADIIATGGLQLQKTNLNKRGGFAAITGFSVVLHDEEGESDIADTHVLSNDEVVVYVCFVNAAEVTADRIEIARGVLESNSAQNDQWRWRVKDGSRKLIRSFPVERLDPVRYPYAFEPGQVFPLAFGNLNVGPDAGTGAAPTLAPMRMTDRFALKATAGALNKTAGQPWQYYTQAQRLARIGVPSGSPAKYTVASDNVTTIDQPERTIDLPGVRAAASNDVTDYRLAINGDVSDSVSVGTGDNLDLWFSGSPKLGELTSITVEISADGTYDYTIYKDTTSKATASGVEDDQSVALVVGDFDDWSMALINIAINGSGGAVSIENVKVQVGFDDFLSLTDQAPELWQEVTGFEDVTTAYYDGSVVAGAGTVLRNPVDQLEALLRANQTNAIEQANIGAGFPAAVTSRSAWYFDWFIKDLNDEKLIGDLCELAGIHIFPSGSGFNVSVNDKTRTATHFFDGDFHMPVTNSTTSSPSVWKYEFQVAPVDASQILNEFALRYGLNGATGEYRKSSIASGQYRLTGTDARLNTTAATLTAATADFVTNNVVAGETVYVSGDIAYTVVTRDSATVLTITPSVGSGVSEKLTDTEYWIGPNLRAECLLSQLSFKTVNALGTKQETIFDDGGFKTPFIQHDATADLVLDYFVEWFAYPRDTVSFPVFHPAINLEKGDVVMLDHAQLFASKKPVSLTTVTGEHNDSDTTIQLAASLVRAGDYVYVETADGQPEVMLCGSINYTTKVATVTRARLNTEAITIPNGAAVKRLTVKWLVTGLKPLTPDRPFMEVEAMQMPNDYKPVGIVSAASHPVYGSATEVQRLSSGWSTLRNGRVIDLDQDSNISHAGADSGTHSIDAVP